jgi:ABC-type transport system involved in cytochrome c biogenesis permease subunit
MKQISIASTFWIIIFLIDFIFELFQINKSGVRTTLLGLKITTKMTTNELNTLFSPTLNVLFGYLMFIIIWLFVYYLLDRKQQK